MRAATAARAERTARDAAREYIARGWSVVPIAARSKKPSLEDGTLLYGWERGGYTTDDIDPAGNVGIILGN
jgi:hypothetical protein